MIAQSTKAIDAAIYARVSLDAQAQEQTIESQVADLRRRVVEDNASLQDKNCFLDDGVSGSTLNRPALERLRDAAYVGQFQRLYVHSPDRLARKYAYQVLLIDELQKLGIEIVFLNRAIGVSPEEDLLLQMQGMFAEYERAKIMERSRRGKRHAATRGLVNVLSAAPYGYRYVTRHEGDGQAAYEIDDEQANVVRQVFNWAAVAMRFTANRSVVKVLKARCPTRTIVALVPMPIALAENACANAVKCVPTSLKRPFGLMPASCFGIRRCFAKSMSDAWLPRATATL